MTAHAWIVSAALVVASASVGAVDGGGESWAKLGAVGGLGGAVVFLLLKFTIPSLLRQAKEEREADRMLHKETIERLCAVLDETMKEHTRAIQENTQVIEKCKRH